MKSGVDKQTLHLLLTCSLLHKDVEAMLIKRRTYEFDFVTDIRHFLQTFEHLDLIKNIQFGVNLCRMSETDLKWVCAMMRPYLTGVEKLYIAEPVQGFPFDPGFIVSKIKSVIDTRFDVCRSVAQSLDRSTAFCRVTKTTIPSSSFGVGGRFCKFERELIFTTAKLPVQFAFSAHPPSSDEYEDDLPEKPACCSTKHSYRYYKIGPSNLEENIEECPACHGVRKKHVKAKKAKIIRDRNEKLIRVIRDSIDQKVWSLSEVAFQK